MHLLFKIPDLVILLLSMFNMFTNVVKGTAQIFKLIVYVVNMAYVIKVLHVSSSIYSMLIHYEKKVLPLVLKQCFKKKSSFIKWNWQEYSWWENDISLRYYTLILWQQVTLLRIVVGSEWKETLVGRGAYRAYLHFHFM